jgi:hypothetical protein
MPANLPPQYFEVEKRYREARTLQEKIAILKEMLAIVPKHKGTEKLQAELKSKISRLQKEAREKPKTARRDTIFHPKREGAAQVVIVGPPNSGKSKLLSSLTRATPEVAPYPFTTQIPQVGMMEFEDIKIQMVDTPPITEEHIAYWQIDIIRNADLVLLVVDAFQDDVIEYIDGIIKRLKDSKIELITGEEGEQFVVGPVKKRTLLVANKIDLPQSRDNLSIIKEFYGNKFPIVSISAETGEGIEELKGRIFQELDIIRVYTKTPGKPPDMKDPLILKTGSTVLDAARAIHKDFEKNLKYARLWGSSKFPGQRVERNYILKDKDIVEFHI